MTNLFTRMQELMQNENYVNYKITGCKYVDSVVQLMYKNKSKFFISKYDTAKNDGSYSKFKLLYEKKLK